ncbi:hypothetical protein DEU56DRAFT_773797 [Suillus clintonianus]|uniref:uncharacterized protein n=1 Tax=Suillus clintonianus TaxID=1904413 RepID=UPI001B87D562|nr:uncharacterized protein DEU56DRAFT_773797 [Suillus clintonianus]KAG2153224.1 hypothetical protein DEU56DRAFT_773797 [Suillus clintonianus]
MAPRSRRHLRNLVIFLINQGHAASLRPAVGLQLKEGETQRGPLCRFLLPLPPRYMHCHRYTDGHGQMHLRKLEDELRMNGKPKL